MPGRMRAFLELLRPANLVTAAADVLAGYAIAGLANPDALPWLLAATVCLYGGGVVLNDYFDRAVDAVERPERAIPSGRVTAKQAAVLGFGLLGAGILLASRATAAAFVVACSIAACVVLYDAWGKHRAIFGPINMGACRGLNLMLGVAAVPLVLETAWPLAGLPVVYICAVTAISRGEVHGGRRGTAVAALILLGCVLLGLAAMSRHSWSGLAWTAVLAWQVVPPFWRAYGSPGPERIRSAVKAGVLSLVLLNAALGASFAGPLYSLIIAATAILAAMLARLFAVT